MSETDSDYLLGIDLGGTNIKAGVVRADGQIQSKVSLPTEADRGPQIGVKNIAAAGRKAVTAADLEFDQIRGVGLATPGTMDIPAGLLLEPPNLQGWENLPIRQQVAELLEKETVLQNDANAAAYGEFWVGAGREAHSLVFWTLGTGIGGGIIIGDTIVEGAHSHGSECGHIIIEMENGRRCDTGQYGTLEAYASAKSLIARCKEGLAAGQSTSLSTVVDQGTELTPLIIGQHAESGDEFALQLVLDTAKYLGVGTTTVMHTINPDLVLFGGAMTFGRNETELGRRFLQRIRDEVKVRAFPVPYERTKIDFATLGSDAGFIGAAGCARLAFQRRG